MGRRTLYYFCGFALGALIELSVKLAIHRPHTWESAGFGAMGLGTSFGVLFLYIAERKRKIPSVEDLHRPLRLFPRDR